MPIHVYDNVTGYAAEGDLDETCPAPLCFEPGIEHDAFSTQVTLGNYGDDAVMGDTYSFNVSFTVPDTGFFFLAIHLDYGLKGTDNYEKYGYDHAVACGTAGDAYPMILIPNWQSYDFQWALGDQDSDDASICSFNVWKRNPGVGGMVFVQLEEEDTEGVPGGDVTFILNETGETVGTAVPDEDGWYMIFWRHRGRPALYTVTLDPPDGYLAPDPQEILLKANHFEEVNFTLIEQ
jgi:hypothetical protein